MKTVRIIRIMSATVFAAAISAGAIAQQTPPAAPAAATAPDCAKQPARHDHGAERGTPNPKASAAGCPVEVAASGAVTRKAKPAHDHGKFHKNQ